MTRDSRPTRPSFRARVLLVLALGLSVLSSCDNQYDVVGRTAFAKGSYGKAVEYLRIALDKTPNDDKLRYLYAISLSKTGRVDDAVKNFERLLPNPDLRSSAIRRMVESLLAARRAKDAEDRVRAAIVETPDDALLIQALGDIQKQAALAKRETVLDDLRNRLGAQASRRHHRRVDQCIAADPAGFGKFADQLWIDLQNAGYGTNHEAIEALIHRARSEMMTARATYEKAVALDPAAFRPRLFLGQLALDAGRTDLAAPLLREVARLQKKDVSDPQDRLQLTEARYLGIELFRKATERDQPDEAIRFIEENLASLPSKDPLLLGLCDLYYRTERLTELEESATAFLKSNPRSAPASFYKGYVLFKRKRYHDACVYLGRARDNQPSNWNYNRFLGLALLATGTSNARALPHLEFALTEGRKDAELVIAYATALERAGDPERAQSILSDAVTRWFRNPNSDDHRAVLAALQDHYQRHGGDLSDLRQVRKLHAENPTNAFVSLRLADLERSEGRFDDARKLVNTVRAQAPDMPEAQLVAARIELGAHDWRSALKHLRKLEECDPGRADTPWMAAEAHLRRRELAEAETAALLALERDKNHARAKGVLLRIYLAQKNHAGVVASAVELLKKDPGNTEYLTSLAQAQEGLGQTEDCFSTLLKLETALPNDRDVLLDLARVLTRLRRYDEARTRLEKAATLPKASSDYLIEVADAMHSARAPERGLALVESLLATMPRGPQRTKILRKKMVLQDAVADYLGALDTLAELRRTGEVAAGVEEFVILGRQSGALHEVVSMVDQAKASGEITPRARRLAIPCLLDVGRFTDAQNELAALTQSGEIPKDGMLLERARADLGADGTRLPKTLPLALRTLDARGKGRLVTIWLSQLLERGQAKAGLTILNDALGVSPESAEAHVAAARLVLAEGDLERARALLERAATLDPRRTTDARDLLAPVLVALGKPVQKEDEPSDRGALALVRVLSQTDRPPSRTFGRFLSLVHSLQFDAAKEAALEIEDLPYSFRPALADLAGTLSGLPKRAPLVAELLARSSLLLRERLLGTRVFNELTAADAYVPPIAPFLLVFRGWVLTRYGRPNEAAVLVISLLEERGKEPLVVLVAALAALENVGPDNLALLVDRQLAGALPPYFARDLAVELDSHGRPDLALRYLGRTLGAPPELLAQRALMAHRLGDHALAGRIVEKLPAQYTEEPGFALLRAHTRCLEPKTRKAAIEEVRALLTDPKLIGVIDPLAAVGAAADAELSTLLSAWIDRCLGASRYDPETIQRILDVVRGPLRDRVLERRLKLAMNTLDPSAALRRTPRDKRPRSAF